MALRLVEVEPLTPFNFICTPTGYDLPEMFEHWQKLSRLLGSPIIPLATKTLKDVCRQEKALPNWRMRFCTRILKIQPFKRFLLANQPAISYVGLRADEQEREGTDYGGENRLKIDPGQPEIQRFPLQEWGWTLPDVNYYLSIRKVTIPDRTDCDRCFFQRLGEWYLLWRDYPDRYADAETQEADFGATFRSGKRDSWPAGLKDLRGLFEQGKRPDVSLNMMAKRQGICRACTL